MTVSNKYRSPDYMKKPVERAIASPLMAEYILFLYKTVRKILGSEGYRSDSGAGEYYRNAVV